MARRFYLSKIREVYDDTLGSNVWRHRLQDPGFENLDLQGGIIATDPVTGEPSNTYTLCLVGGIDFRPLEVDEELVALPIITIDNKLDACETPRRNRFKTELADRLGVTNFDQLWNNANGLRSLLDYFGQANWPEFDSNNFDLSDN